MKSVFFCIQKQQTSKYKSLCEIRRTSFSFYIPFNKTCFMRLHNFVYQKSIFLRTI